MIVMWIWLEAIAVLRLSAIEYRARGQMKDRMDSDDLQAFRNIVFPESF